MRTLHVHFTGAPGMGKTVLAAAAFTELKMRDIPAHLVLEVAKEYVWEGRMHPDHQIEVTKEQLRRELVPHGSAAVVITDSPPMLGVAYAHPEDQDALRQLVLDVTADWKILTFVQRRELDPNTFETAGRIHSCQESLVKADEIEQELQKAGIPFQRLRLTKDIRDIPVLAFELADQIEQFLRQAPIPLKELAVFEHKASPVCVPLIRAPSSEGMRM